MEVLKVKANYKTKISKLATIPEAQERYRLGRKSVLDVATEVGAIVRIGRIIRIDIPAMDKALENY